ncbi:MiaB family protein [Dehalogenimonas sp. WBC-2]|nr:MiaB family protein [Dehalogenimonas sp. WBC-2]
MIETLGCKLNQSESETMWRDLTAAGYSMVNRGEYCDVLILNSCTVTQIADRKARQTIRAAAISNPDIKIIVTGCYAQRTKESLYTLPGVIMVEGNAAKAKMPESLRRLGCTPDDIHFRSTLFPHNRSLIKIQDGCDQHCAYCIVPLVRPKKSCVNPKSIINQINLRQADGCREVVLTGTEIGEYQSDGLDLTGLLDRILTETSVERIRISSLQPKELSEKLIDLWRNTRLCRHFHLSLQSGTDNVLRRMRRRYTTNDYRRTVDMIRAVVPNAGITTDIITGFPGETDEDFEASFQFIDNIGFARLHVFPFSPRPGTAAATMPGRLNAEVLKARSARLRRLAQRCETGFKQSCNGLTLEVLIEEYKDNKWVGYTDNYIRVALQSDTPLNNQIISVLM